MSDLNPLREDMLSGRPKTFLPKLPRGKLWGRGKAFFKTLPCLATWLPDYTKEATAFGRMANGMAQFWHAPITTCSPEVCSGEKSRNGVKELLPSNNESMQTPRATLEAAFSGVQAYHFLAE